MLQVLFWTLENKNESEKWLLAMLGTHYLLNDFHVKTEHRVKILTEVKNYYSRLISNNKEVNKNVSAFFRANKEKIKTFMQVKNFENQYFTYFKMRSMENKPLIQDLENEGINYDVKNYVHMYLNRFFEKNQIEVSS